MTDQEYEEWLDNLREGDEVCYHNRWRGYVPIKIIKITPKRWIKTEHGLVFKDGWDRSDTWDSKRIQPITAEVKQTIWRRDAEQIVSKIAASNLDDEQLAGILEILKPKAIKSAE